MAVLKAFLEEQGVTQAELARGTDLTTGYVSLLANEETGASQETIHAVLVFLSKRLRRSVTYEECFGSPVAAGR